MKIKNYNKANNLKKKLNIIIRLFHSLYEHNNFAYYKLLNYLSNEKSI